MVRNGLDRLGAHRAFMGSLAAKGGPKESEYHELNQWFHLIARGIETGELERSDVRELWDAAGDAFTVRTLQGWVCRKPRGYFSPVRPARPFAIASGISPNCLRPLKSRPVTDQY